MAELLQRCGTHDEGKNGCYPLLTNPVHKPVRYALLTFRITHRISNVIRRRLPQTKARSRK